MRANPSRKGQRGAAILIFAAVVLTGLVWLGVGALGNATVGRADREVLTGGALAQAKETLLAHVALMAARSNELYPGRLPCPEVRSTVGTALEGYAGPFNTTTTPASGTPIACESIGRLPWATLGVDQIRDGYGEALWYAVDTTNWAWTNVDDARVINPGTANALSLDGTANSVVAVIIAPGRPISATGAAPAGCSVVNQPANRSTGTPVAANFLECGNEANLFKSVATSGWSNDRTITITAAEVMTAIAGAVSDRLQRQVAPALDYWRTTESQNLWGARFLPYASPFNTTPSANGLCGTGTDLEGLLPTNSSPTCDTRFNEPGNISALLGLFNLGCTRQATYMECGFLRLFGAIGATITLTAPDVAGSFRQPVTAGDIAITDGGSVVSFSNSLLPATGNAAVVVNVTWPLSLGVLTTVYVRVNYLQNAPILTDTRMAWFVNNEWSRYTYYGLATGARLGAASLCSGVADPDCLTVSGLPVANGNTNDKQFVLTLMGKAVGGQTQPSNNATNYLETHTVGTTTFSYQTVTTTSNDRLATCPFQYTADGPTTHTICN